MKFTSKIKGGSLACGILTLAGLGWSGPVNSAWLAAAPNVVVQDTFTAQASFQANGGVSIAPALDWSSTASSKEFKVIPVTHWYNNKHWWKKNAPIIGGAAGGGLIGGLAGGGKGLLIGGAAGAGGGALYKHYSHRHHYHQGTEYRSGSPTQYHQAK